LKIEYGVNNYNPKKTVQMPKTVVQKPKKVVQKRTPTERNIAIGAMLKKGGSANITSNPTTNMIIANQLFKDRQKRKPVKDSQKSPYVKGSLSYLLQNK
jgi:hypothetical protein